MRNIKRFKYIFGITVLILPALLSCGGGENFKATVTDQLNFNRGVTTGLLADIEKTKKGDAFLRRRVGAGRAPLGWHLMHLAATEDYFAGSLAGGGPAVSKKWAGRFRSGKKPASDIPPLKDVRKYLNDTRAALLKTIANSDGKRTITTPRGGKMDFKKAVMILLYHEPHHQGQARATFNILRAGPGK